MKPLLTWLCLIGAVTCSSSNPTHAASKEAVRWWEQGRDAILEGESDRAISCFLLSLETDPTYSRSYLSVAAAYLDKGDSERAVPYLEKYLEMEPGHIVIRRHLAEILTTLKRPYSARLHFERFVAEVQSEPALAQEHLISCHSRLMEINLELGQTYYVHLHRGIGLYWLARTRLELGNPKGKVSAESLFCRAATELKLAHKERTLAARPQWYLYRVWKGLNQQHSAAKSLRATFEATAYNDLTPTEKDDLLLALFASRCARSDRK